MSVFKKLMQARIDLQGRNLKKSGHNKFAGYQYFELGDFLPVVQEIFYGLKLCGIVSYNETIATLTILDIEDNSKVEITSPMSSAALKGCHPVQNIGAVETYQRRYLWVTALEIVEHDVLDATTGKDVPSSFKSVPQDAWDQLEPSEQKRLQTIVDCVRAEFDKHGGLPAGGLAGMKLLDEQGLDNDEKVAIWARFNSKERAAMEPHKRIKKAA